MRCRMLVPTLLLFGCATTPNNVDLSDREIPFAFACNEWVDENHDQLVQPTEFQGIKTSFAFMEKVTFVARYEDVGDVIVWRLFAPDGSLYQTGSSTGRYRTGYRWVYWEVAQLLGRGERIGMWRMEWYLEGSPTLISRVRLTM